MRALDALRLPKLQKQIAYLWTNEDYFRPLFLAAGLTSPHDLKTIEDFRRLPAFLDKDRHRESQDASLQRYGHPLGLHLTTALENAIHLAATSGTTGTPTFYVFTRKDLDITYRVLGRMFALAGLRPGDTTFHAFALARGYNLCAGPRGLWGAPRGARRGGRRPKVLGRINGPLRIWPRPASTRLAAAPMSSTLK
jgi:phenylacetate-CoA ligase